MISIKIDERCVFAYDIEKPIIHIHQHKNGRYSGESRYIGEIEFFDYKQMSDFQEMIELCLEERKK